MKLLKFFALLVALAGVAALALVYAPVATGQRGANGPEMTIFGGPGVSIGATVRDVTPGTKGEAGVTIEEVQPGSPAEKAGLKRGDVVTSFDGERVRSVRQFLRLVRETAPDRAVKATVVRDGKRMDVELTPIDRAAEFRLDRDQLRERLGDLGSLADRLPYEFNFELEGGRGRLGVTVQEMTPQLEKYFGANGGVLVTSVSEGSPAEKAGLKAGDVITAVNGASVATRSELSRELRRADEQVSLTVVRDRKEQTIKATIEPRARTTRRGRPA